MTYHCSTCGYTGDNVFSNWDEKEMESCIICQENKNAKLFIEHLHIICPVCNGILEKMYTMENIVAIPDMENGVDISVFQWFRDDAGYPFMNPLIELTPIQRDILANAAFEDMLANPSLINNPIDFQKLASKASFAFIRTMTNAGTLDKSFGLNWAGTQKVGIPRGPYCNWVTGGNMMEVVDQFYDAVKLYDLGELPPVLDYEPFIPANPNNILAFLGKLNSLFKHPKGVLVYSSMNFWWQLKPIPTWMNLSWIKRWVANWTTAFQPVMPTGWPSYEFWQYSAKGDGYAYGVKSKQIDLDRFNGTSSTLKTWYRYPPISEPTIEEQVVNLERDVTDLQARVYILEHPKSLLDRLFGK